MSTQTELEDALVTVGLAIEVTKGPLAASLRAELTVRRVYLADSQMVNDSHTDCAYRTDHGANILARVAARQAV